MQFSGVFNDTKDITSMEIESRKLKLVPLKEEDIEDIHQLNSIAEVAQFNTIGIPKDYQTTYKIYESMLLNEDVKGWTIRLKESDQFIGIFGLRLAPARFRSGEIHYSLLPEYWDKGYGTEAVKSFLKFAFEELNLHRIEAGCAIHNAGSIKVLEKSGFVREGQKRLVLPLKTGWADNYEYAILASDRS